ncbi:MAG: ABC transporter permease [Epulopiscium sp. Nele67-Bin001]|nr:MAG: ABC transporter permease [Epulopiscium sp. Nele67-Bin001]
MKIKREEAKEIKWHILLGLITILLIFPIIFAVSSSFKDIKELTNNPLALIPQNFTFNNYFQVLDRMPFGTITYNTVFIATIVTVFKIVTSIMAAYAFVYFDFKFKSLLYFIFISTIFIPFTVIMIPNFLTISSLGLNDNLLGVVLPQLSDATGIFLIRQSMKSVPKSLIEVAELENLSHFRRIKDVIFPIIRPAVISTGIMFFINSWNEYVWPMLILKSQDNYTLSLALQSFMSSEGGTDFTVAMTVSVITMVIPLILYLFFQKYIINTFASSGIKG